MGREIRRVPTDWTHPKYEEDQIRYEWQKDAYHPLYDLDYDLACEEWYENIKKFKPTKYAKWYHEDAGDPPDPSLYRHRKWSSEEATLFQVYETVSEGTPVTPVFATKEELVEYLVIHGDYWDQKSGRGGWNKKSAESFVKSEWAPSMIVNKTKSGIEIKKPRDHG